ncbi:anosmin-1a [Aplochiton taeniatus]
MFPKSRGVWTSLPWWSIFLLSLNITHARKQNDDPSSVDSVYRARCASRCLSLHSTRIPTLSKSNQVERNGSLGWCQKHKQCAKCLEPCKDTWEVKRRGQCRDLCESSFPRKNWECLTSCEFLQSVIGAKQGECPQAERASGFAAACVEECAEDDECSAQKKCCSNGCGHTCQTPKNLYKGAPLKPRMELSFRESPPGKLEVRWSSRFNVSAEPAVYVLQRRWNFGIQPSEDAATLWQVAAQTTEERASLVDMRGGRWYQFRVAAVNVHGTRGYTTPSRHIHSTKDPSRPPAPTDLRVTNLTYGPGRVVSARVLWSVPQDPDVPINHYKVAWSWVALGELPGDGAPKTKRRKIVREAHVDLDSLRANRTYTVEVLAVSYWKHTQIKGTKTSIHFSTQPTLGRVASPAGPLSAILDVGTPFYQDSQLQVRVYWQRSSDLPGVRYRVQWEAQRCGRARTSRTKKLITRESFAGLPDLLFSCKYRILLQPVGGKEKPWTESATFFTPSCASIQAKSSKVIACPEEGTTAPLKVTAKAENLTAAFEAQRGNVTAVFTWDVVPSNPAPVVMGYQVTWAESTSSGRNDDDNHLPNSLVSQSQILPADHNILVVSGLRLASVYKLDVQVIGATGEGPVTSRTFHTPGSHTVLKHKTRLRKHHQRHQPIIERH